MLLRINYYFLMLICTLSLISQAYAQPLCQQLNNDGKSSHFRCSVPTESGENRSIDVLDLHGTFTETARTHGRFLASEINQGTIPAVLRKLEYILSNIPSNQQVLFRKITQCAMKKYHRSVPKEFLTMHDAMVQGMREAGVKTISSEDFLTASFAAEYGIFGDAFLVKLSENPVAALSDIALQCGFEVPGLLVDDLIRALQTMKGKFKSGCTGFATPETLDGELIHGRNFDHSLIGTFERFPVMLIQNPPQGYRYVAIASAGVHYAGGVSGFNEAGLSISVHELQTREVALFHSARRGVTAPYLANLILEQASTIDEAYSIAHRYRHFGSWTLLVADSKNQESAAIEFTAKRIVLTRRTQGHSTAQTNHFTDPAMAGADIKLSFGHILESPARYAHVQERLKKHAGNIDLDWAMETLGAHWDHLVGARAFGRTPTKVYTTMSHIMIPQKGLFYTTLGDTYPASNSTYVGFHLSFLADRTKEAPFEIVEVKRHLPPFLSQHPHWTQSHSLYVASYMAYRNYQGASDSLLQAHKMLSDAMELAARDGIFEVPYAFLRGRLALLEAARLHKNTEGVTALSSAWLASAEKDFRDLLAAQKADTIILHPYERSLVILWLGRVKMLQSTALTSEVATLMGEALSLHQSLLSHKHEQGLIRALINSYWNAKTSQFIPFTWKEAEGGELDYVTAE